MTPDDARYYDPGFDNMGIPVEYAEPIYCGDCHDILDESELDNESQGLKFCFNCWRNYH